MVVVVGTGPPAGLTIKTPLALLPRNLPMGTYVAFKGYWRGPRLGWSRNVATPCPSRGREPCGTPFMERFTIPVGGPETITALVPLRAVEVVAAIIPVGPPLETATDTVTVASEPSVMGGASMLVLVGT